MKKIKVADLKAGMIFDQPVFIDENNVLVQARQEIKANDIDRLVKWGIDEVETKGNVLKSKPVPIADAAQAAMQTATATNQSAAVAIANAKDPEMKIVLQAYDSLRKNKRNFKGILGECAEVLEANISSLMEKKQFDNQAVLKVANRLVEEITAKNLLLVIFQASRFTQNAHIHHALHAGAYAVVLGQVLQYSRPRLQELMFATILMDIGMFQLPGHIRNKQAALTDAERATVKTHPLLGYQLLLKEGKVKASLAQVALQHQEAFDGSGYPQSLKGGQIEDISRIATIADCYTAMIEKRPHRAPILPYDAMKTMLSVEMQRFDPKLLRLFLGRISIYPIGSMVQLSNGDVGMVISCKADKPLRPVLRLMRDKEGLPFNGLSFVDLVKQTDLYIVNALHPGTAGIDLEAEI